MLSPSEMLCSTFPERWFLCRQNHLPGNLDSQGPPTIKKQLFQGVKPKKNCPTFFCGSVIHIKNTFCKKKSVKTAIRALSSGQSNLQTPIWGCHRQLDDQNRNPNINNRDHIVGKLTRFSPEIVLVVLVNCPTRLSLLLIFGFLF